MVSDRRLVLAQCFLKVGTDAIHVNVQLVLGAACDGVDGQADVIAWEGAMQGLVNVFLGLPGIGKIIRRAGSPNGRGFQFPERARWGSTEIA